MANLREVYIVDGARTPLLKGRQKPGPFSASDLAVAAGRSLLLKQDFAPNQLDEVIVGCVSPRENEANIGRIIGLRLGCGNAVPGWTVQRNCASGMQALDSALKDITLGRSDLVLAGGTEAMSHMPLIYNDKMVNWLADWQSSKTLPEKLKTTLKFRPGFLSPIIGIMHGLTDPLVGMIMGQTAENLAYRFHITREEMDQFALRSHQRALRAQEQGYLKDEMVPVFSGSGQMFNKDDGVRHDTSMEALAKLKPYFDRKFGMVTAGNSAQVSDGAAMLLLASADAIKKYKLPVLGKIVDVQWAGLEPEEMGLGPVYATTPILQRQGLSFADIDYWEINEAFAAQVIACIRAWEDAEFCRKNLHLEHALGKLDEEKLNIDGGGVAIGHPVGASGARIVLHLLNILHRNKAKRGMATICIGGGQGGAMLVERVTADEI